MIRLQTPVPALYRGFVLHPDDATDPRVFRVDLSRFGMPTVRLVFGSSHGSERPAIHTGLGGQPISLYKQPDETIRRQLVAGATLLRARRNARKKNLK
jgi:hypothetical protein